MKKVRCKIIAEAGVNHNGSLDKAFKLVEVASQCDADFIKFQLFEAKNLVTPSAFKADYQVTEKVKNQSQFEMLQKLELDIEQMIKIKNYCAEKKIGFICSAFDLNILAAKE